MEKGFVMTLSDQEKAQARDKGYDEQSPKEDAQKWQGSSAEAEDGLLESKAGNEEIHPYGWCRVTDLKVVRKMIPRCRRLMPYPWARRTMSGATITRAE
jgi:hypothetical protein